MSALRCIDDAKSFVIPPPLIICCPSPRAFADIAKAAASAAPSSIHLTVCSVAVCKSPQQVCEGRVEDGGLLSEEVMEPEDFRNFVSSGDVFIQGDLSSFSWAYSCRALEQLQVLLRLERHFCFILMK
jgi:hypothetical protein